jgi:hypothetical protein
MRGNFFMKSLIAVCLAAIGMCLVVFALETTPSAPQMPHAPVSADAAERGSEMKGAAADFAITTTSARQSVVAGSGVTYTFNVASSAGTFYQPVVLAASGLPPGAAATFSPAVVTPAISGATTTMTIRTAAQHATSRLRAPGVPLGAPMLAMLLLFPLGVRRRTWVRLSCWVAVIAAAGALQGCDNGRFAVPLSETVASQATYTVTVMGTSGATQHSVRLEVTVQSGSGMNT